MKKFLLSLLLGLSMSLPMAAATKTVIFSSTLTTNLFLGTNGAIITAVRVSGVAGSVGFGVFDFQNTSLQYTNGNFTNYVQSSITCSNYYTNYVGVLETNTYPCLTNTATLVAAATNLPNLVVYIVGSTNTTISAGSTDTPFVAYKGITVTNSGAGTLSIDYYPVR